MADVKVETSAQFDKELERLARKYRTLLDTVSDLVAALKRGELPGNQLQGTGARTYKVRLPNRDAKRGKSGGFRLIYYVRIKDHIFLLEIYSKTERDDISDAEIRKLVNQINR